VKDPGIRHLAISVDQFERKAMGELKKRGGSFWENQSTIQATVCVFFSDGDGNPPPSCIGPTRKSLSHLDRIIACLKRVFKRIRLSAISAYWGRGLALPR